MKYVARYLGLLLAITLPMVGLAQEVIIEAFDSAGQLTFSTVPNATGYRVEWAASLDGPWTSFADQSSIVLGELDTTEADSFTVSVPMLYRVVATVTNPPPPADFVVTSPGSSAYVINGESNPTLELMRGHTYVLDINAFGHPFWIKTSPTTGVGDIYSTGVINNGAMEGQITFTVPLDAPDTLYYICQFHSAMQGSINIPDDPNQPSGAVVIPSGTNSGTNPLADGEGHTIGYPATYDLTFDAFYMDQYPVTKALWDEVYAWATHADRGANVYSFDNAGSGKGTNHPVHTVNWYDVVKWCNARSEKEGRSPVYTVNGEVYRTGREDDVAQTDAAGYRLPTEVEWEYAARGGLQSKRFPWGDEINHDYANYQADGSGAPYDTSHYTEWTPHPSYYDDGNMPYTSPVGSFAANGYGLYDMAGNVWEWVFDLYPDHAGSGRMARGGSWGFPAVFCRVGHRDLFGPSAALNLVGFRAVLPPGQ